jgi:hypothetical protein
MVEKGAAILSLDCHAGFHAGFFGLERTLFGQPLRMVHIPFGIDGTTFAVLTDHHKGIEIPRAGPTQRAA